MEGLEQGSAYRLLLATAALVAYKTYWLIWIKFVVYLRHQMILRAHLAHDGGCRHFIMMPNNVHLLLGGGSEDFGFGCATITIKVGASNIRRRL